MPDFQRMVRERLRGCGLEPTREWEIVDELAQHLRDCYELQLSLGAGEEEAERAVVAELEGRDLAGELRQIEERSKDPVALGSGEADISGQTCGMTCATRHARCDWTRGSPGYACYRWR